MNIKVLAIITVLSLAFTITIFVLTSNSPSSSNMTNEISPTGIPTVNPDQPPAEGKAKITGKICAEGSSSQTNTLLQKGVTVVAEKTTSKQRFTKYVSGPISEDKPYSLEVDPGNYEVYTEVNNRNKIGLYSQFVLCKLGPEGCLDHQLVQVGANDSQVTPNIDICDYTWSL